MKMNIVQRLLGHFGFVPRGSILFASISVLLFALSMVQVDCPIVGSLDESMVNTSENLEVLEIRGELVDYRIQHAWCANAFITGNYVVYITIANEGSQELSTPMLIEGKMSEDILRTYASGRGRAYKLIRLGIPGNETQHIQEEMQLWASGLAVSKGTIYNAEFSAILDPARIKASCPLCGGSGKVSLFDAIKARL